MSACQNNTFLKDFLRDLPVIRHYLAEGSTHQQDQQIVASLDNNMNSSDRFLRESLYSFDDVDKVRVGGNRAHAAFSVGRVRGAEHSDLGADVEVDSDLVPALDDLAGTNLERERFVSFVTGVEDCSVLEGTLVVYLDVVALLGLCALLALSQHLDRVLLNEVRTELRMRQRQ